MSQVGPSHFPLLSTKNPFPSLCCSGPLLLATRVQESVKISIFRNGDGTLFGEVDNCKTSLVGFPSVLQLDDVENALDMLSGGAITWDGFTINFRPRLLGGGNSLSNPEKIQVLSGGMSIAEILAGSNQEEAANKVDAPYVAANVPMDEVYPPHWSVPPIEKNFVGRDSLLQEMKNRLSESSEPVFIGGLGGVGKTRLVLEYLYRHKQSYSTLWWISGEHPEIGFRELGESLGILKPDEKGEYVIELVKGWLEKNSGWALVFDNVEDSKTLLPFLPAESKGHILATSRNPHAKNSLTVELLSPGESAELVHKLTGEEKSEETLRLAVTLGNLPLALNQAGAYMKATETSYADYAILFETTRKELWKDEKMPKGYPATVGTTWNISIKRIGDLIPGAVELLYRSAYLAPDSMPKSLFFTDGQEPVALALQLHALQKYSLFSWGQKDNTYSVHRLVQAAIQDSLSPAAKESTLQRLVDCLKKEWKYARGQLATWSGAKLLHPHLLSVAHHGKNESLFLPETAAFYYCLGLYSQVHEMNVVRASEHYNEALLIWRKPDASYPINFEEMGHCLAGLGACCRGNGDQSEARKCLEEAREVYRKGEVVPNRRGVNEATCQMEMGMTYLAEQKLSEALPFFTEAASMRRKFLGSNHPDYAVSLSNLGGYYLQSGNFDEAINYYKQVIKIDKKAFGWKHHEVGHDLSSLGSAYASKGNRDLAFSCFIESLFINKELYGWSHPILSQSLINLGLLYRLQGNLALAIECYKKGLGIMEKSFPKWSSNAAIALNNLGSAYQAQKKIPEALEYFEQAFEIFDKTNPEGNALIGVMLLNMGNAYDDLKNHSKAIEFCLKAVAVNERVFGVDHPKVIPSWNILSQVYTSANQLAEGLNCLKKIMDISIKAFGNKSPEAMAAAMRYSMASAMIGMIRGNAANQTS